MQKETQNQLYFFVFVDVRYEGISLIWLQKPNLTWEIIGFILINCTISLKFCGNPLCNFDWNLTHIIKCRVIRVCYIVHINIIVDIIWNKYDILVFSLLNLDLGENTFVLKTQTCTYYLKSFHFFVTNFLIKYNLYNTQVWHTFFVCTLCLRLWSYVS